MAALRHHSRCDRQMHRHERIAKTNGLRPTTEKAAGVESGVLGTIGVVTLRKVKHRRELLEARRRRLLQRRTMGSPTSHFQVLETFFSATAFMQYRRPLGSGPSGKTCPKWASHVLQTVSILFKNDGPSK